MRSLALSLLLAAAVAAGDDGLQQPLKSGTARRYRESGLEAWKKLDDVWKAHRANKKVEEARAREAMEILEETVVPDLEESLEKEWDDETNRTLAEAVRLWFALRKDHPPPEPEGKEAERERRKRERKARKWVMRYGRARSVRNVFDRCRRCDGRGQLRGPFGDPPRVCPSCRGKKLRVDRDGMLEARWLTRSPLYRADVRNAIDMSTALRIGATQPDRFGGPFVTRVSIDGEVQDHGFWVRVPVVEHIHQEHDGKRTTERKTSHVLFHIGKVWYLYTRQYDRDLFEVPKEEPARE